MLLGQVLQFVIIQVATQTHRCQHDNLPVIHTRPTMLGAGLAVDVLAHEVQDFPPQLAIAVNVLQRPQDGNDFVTTIQIQFDLSDGRAIQARLRIEARSHGKSSVKSGARFRENPRFLPCCRIHTYNLRWRIRWKTRTFPGGPDFRTDTSYENKLVNSVGFETGDFSQTAAHQGGAIVSSPALDGMYSLQLLRNGSAAWAEIRQSGTTYYNLGTAFYSFQFRFASQTGDAGLVNFQDTSSNYKAALHINAAGKLVFYDSGGINPLAVGTTVLNPNQTYTISATIGTGSNAAWDVRINGVLEMSGTGNLVGNNGSIKLGGNNAYTANYYYDDVAISPNVIPAGGLIVTHAPNQTATEGALTTSVALGSFTDASFNNATPNAGPWVVNVNWGDNTELDTFTMTAPGNLPSISHIFHEEDNTVTVTVTNRANVASSGSFHVAVNDPPVNLYANSFMANTLMVHQQVVASFTDPGGAELTDHYT